MNTKTTLSALLTALCVFASGSAFAHPKAPPAPLKPVGRVIPRPSSQGVSPLLGIGFEKLDRDVFDPEKAYDKLGAIGVKWVRLQSGWQRTEKVRGQYDFAWLDSVVDNVIRRGMTPWLCLCYGNELYTPEAKKYFGAVGVPPIKTQEERDAWAAYVTATVRHFKGRVPLYEIWNEPNSKWCWKFGVSPAEYGEFATATARAVRAADPAAQIAGFAITNLTDLPYVSAALDTGLGRHLDSVTYHYYTADERDYAHYFEAFKALVRSCNPAIKIIQGESGAQSRPDGKGALRHLAWTPEKQAKILLRHLVSDLSLGVEFASYFSTLDMIEALNGKVGDKASYLDYGYFGVLGADFDADGRSTGEYTPKPAYRALQNLCAALAADVGVEPLPIRIAPGKEETAFGQDLAPAGASLQFLGLKKANGARGFIYWNATDLLTTSFESTTSMIFARLPTPVRLVNLMTGVVHEIPKESLVKFPRSDACTLKNIPVTDYPLLLTFGDFLPFEPAR